MSPSGQLPALGAFPDGEGTSFRVWSGSAERVELCLDDDGGRGEHRLPMDRGDFGTWSAYVPGVHPRTRYGYRVHGPWFPERGSRHNPTKLLLDPYARAVDGDLVPHDAVFGHVRGRDDTVRDDRDSAPYVPRSVVVDDGFDWSGDRRPDVPWPDTVLYELHVRGFTMRHPDVPPHLRGTYAGLASTAAVEHLVGLGVTTVELLPVHQYVDEVHLLERGLTNYWGYNSVGFFAPHGAYSATGTRGEQVREFKEMVRTLHAAGLEVVLDVVYNHTGEGDEHGPTLGLRGLDNAAYYRLRGGRHYADVTGCGNTVDASSPPALRLVLDSLRYWVEEMHVDGFRFDLAPALARTPHGVESTSGFLLAIAQDPVLREVKLIAEPWDLGEGGYRTGRFPPPWAEWNDRFRDGARDFWRGSAAGVRELASRLSGSSDLYAERGPYASVNFVTSHDGFPLRDVVSHERKHNEDNGEDNRDGTEDNRSWNCGVEGDTDDPAVLACRDRASRNLLATLLLSAGTPMLTAGDELGRTQRGNNNAYCQDNEVSWLDWALTDAQRSLCGFTRELLALRRELPVLRRRTFFSGRPLRPGGPEDLLWYGPDGQRLPESGWFDAGLRTLGMLVGADAGSFLLVLHAGDEPLSFPLPPGEGAYEVLADTAQRTHPTGRYSPGQALVVEARSCVLLRQR